MNIVAFVELTGDGKTVTIADVELTMEHQDTLGPNKKTYSASRSSFRHPKDKYTPEIGAKIAASRALMDAALQMYDEAMSEATKFEWAPRISGLVIDEVVKRGDVIHFKMKPSTS